MAHAGSHVVVENVSYRYHARRPAVLDQISLNIEPGCATAMIGRSGCGKSTLLHLIAGLVKPSSGRISIDGITVTKPSRRWVMMFQSPSLYPWMNVTANAGIGLKFAGLPPGEIAQRVGEALELVGLAGYAKSRVTELSGGQQQRVALARSLVMQPDLLLLDEPFAALDTFTRTSLQGDVRRICKERGITLLLVTHDIDEAVIMADRALVMSAAPGKIQAMQAIRLAGPRERDDPAVQQAVAALRRRFEMIAGVQATEDASIAASATADVGYSQMLQA
jgi:NitT/TauT family transport system ATP-binding protein